MNHPVKERLITDAELAKWLMVSKSTLHKLRENGELPYRQVGSCIRYSVCEIEAWLDDRGTNLPRSEHEAREEFSEICNPNFEENPAKELQKAAQERI